MSICGCTGSEPLPIDAPAPQIDFSVGTPRWRRRWAIRCGKGAERLAASP